MIGPALRQRLRRPALGLLALNAAVFLVFALPRTLQERNAAGRVAALRAEVAGERARVEALRARAQALAENARDSERFFEELLKPRKQALLPAIDEIQKAASAEGIDLGRETYTPEEARAGVPARVRVQLPVSGSYDQIVGFLGRLERSKQFLVIDQVSLDAGPDGEARLAIEVSAYYREARARESAGA